MFDAYQGDLECVDEPTPSQWSKMDNSDIFNVTLECIVSITSRKFTDCRLSDNWEELLKLIHDLHINGMPRFKQLQTKKNRKILNKTGLESYREAPNPTSKAK